MAVTTAMNTTGIMSDEPPKRETGLCQAYLPSKYPVSVLRDVTDTGHLPDTDPVPPKR